MSRWLYPILALCLPPIPLIPLIPPPHRAPEPPPLRVRIELDGTTLDVELGTEHTVQLEDREVTMRVSRAVRRFRESGLEFDYPAELSWEVEERGPESTSWMLDRRGVVLIISRFRANDLNQVLASAVEGTMRELGEAATESAGTVELGGLPRPARVVSAQLADRRVVASFVGFATREHCWTLTLTELGEERAEDVRRLLAESFVAPAGK